MSLSTGLVIFFVIDTVVVIAVLAFLRRRAARHALEQRQAASPHRVVTAPRPEYQSARSHGVGRWIALLAAAGLGALAVGAVREQAQRSETAAPAPIAEPASPRDPAPEPAAPAPAAHLPQDDVVTLSLTRDFRLVPWELPAHSLGDADPLVETRPRRIRRAPRVRELRYATLVLGPGRQEIVYAVGNDRRGTRIWVDRDGDGDLLNDGPATELGTGPFATAIRLPAQALYPGVRGAAEFDVWVFQSERGVLEKKASHYSRTQARGTLRLGGQTYDAWLVDQGDNDGDLTNDGIFVDVNGDGQIERRFEYAPPGKAVDIAGQRLRFRIEL